MREVARWGTPCKAIALAAVSLSLYTGGCAVSVARPRSPADIGVTPHEEGLASWYGPGFHGRNTSSGELYDQNAFTAAHRTLPLGTRVRVTNLGNGRMVDVRINDRGPFVSERILDLSHAAAQVLDMVRPGTARIRIELREPRRGRGMPAAIYVVQLGSFLDDRHANRLAARWRDRFQSIHVESADAADRTYFRVRIGPFDRREEAVDTALEASRYGLTALVMER